MTAGLQEKPDVKIDDYVLEHFLLYNGLIGSCPENQPLYKDVRADIVRAINDDSAAKLAIALKVSPLWWEDRLQKIFTEIAEVNKKGAIECLMAARNVYEDTVGDSTPLSNTDWRVRANAARMLAFLDAKEAVPQIAPLLKESNDTHKSAFCHYAYSLASLGTEQARQALLAEMDHQEHWFRVDVAGALAHWPLTSVAQDLSLALLNGSTFDDYMAVAVSRKHSILELAEFADETVQEGFAEIVIALLKGMSGPLHAEHQAKSQLQQAAKKLNELALSRPTTRNVRAAILLNEFVDRENQPRNAIRDLSDRAHYSIVKETLSKPDLTRGKGLGELTHGLYLCRRFKLNELAPYLTPLLKDDFHSLPELIECIADLGSVNDAPRIAQIIEDRINLSDRCILALSAHPVVEDNDNDSLIYWTALKALGLLPHSSSLSLLSRAVNDYAPDKREQALLSLQRVCLSEEFLKSYDGNLQELMKERMSDPAVGVQKAALSGIALHRMHDLLPDVMKTLHSRETTIQKQSADTLYALAEGKQRDAVKQSLEANLRKEMDSAKKYRVQKILDRLG